MERSLKSMSIKKSLEIYKVSTVKSRGSKSHGLCAIEIYTDLSHKRHMAGKYKNIYQLHNS